MITITAHPEGATLAFEPSGLVCTLDCPRE